jgi:hypothetical protein
MNTRTKISVVAAALLGMSTLLTAGVASAGERDHYRAGISFISGGHQGAYCAPRAGRHYGHYYRPHHWKRSYHRRHWDRYNRYRYRDRYHGRDNGRYYDRSGYRIYFDYYGH